MRAKIAEIIRGKVALGSKLPWLAIVVLAIIYPKRFLFWYLNKECGYQITRDVWNINVAEWDSYSLGNLVKDESHSYNVVKINGVYTLIKAPPDKTVVRENNKKAELYEKLRRMNPREFAELHKKNIETGVAFDELLDKWPE